MTLVTATQVRLIENLQREDLNPIRRNRRYPRPTSIADRMAQVASVTSQTIATKCDNVCDRYDENYPI